MIEAEETIAYCHSCGEPMDVTPVAPFTNVECPACGKHTRVKREFGPYTLMKRHAAGGMSMVFSAHDNTLDREVAVKILSENYSADERRISAFEQEARLTASLGHPHVVKVFTTGRAFGRFYIAMEFVPGGHFEHQIRERGKIPEVEMLRLAVEVAQGLKAAQSAGLIHRDVKPGNILLDAEGHAKLVDFGLALVTQGGMAQATELWATPYYVPPETVEGHPEDFRSDIYAFGATLYHALAGKPPCDEESMASDILREAKKRVVPLAASDPTISAATCRIVDRAMAYRPEDRFASYDEMIAAIHQSLAFIKSGRTELNAAARRARKKRQERIILTSIAATTLLVGIAAVWFLTRKKTAPPAPVPAAIKILENPTSNPITPSKPDRAAEIAQTYRQAHASLESGDYETASRSFLTLLRNPEVQEPSRSWAGIEAIMTLFLDGKSLDARKTARETLSHIQALPPETHSLGRNLTETLERLNGPRPVAIPNPDPSAAGAPQLVAIMLASLKNWEQGLLAPAATGFREATAISLPQDHAWAAIYQKLAADYLADHETLNRSVFESLPKSPADCDRAIDQLNATLASLKSRGRSRFNVRSWQIDITRHRKFLFSQSLQNPASSPPPPLSLSDVLARLDSFARECHYQDASAFLTDLPESPVIPARVSLLALTKSASGFITDLHAELAKASATVDLTLRSGEEISSLRYDPTDGLIAAVSDGNTRQIRWSDLFPDAAITLHQKFLSSYPGDAFDLVRRNEGAIAHLWLTGERERAVTAANKLSASNPNFALRWETISKDLPK